MCDRSSRHFIDIKCGPRQPGPARFFFLSGKPRKRGPALSHTFPECSCTAQTRRLGGHECIGQRSGSPAGCCLEMVLLPPRGRGGTSFQASEPRAGFYSWCQHTTYRKQHNSHLRRQSQPRCGVGGGVGTQPGRCLPPGPGLQGQGGEGQSGSGCCPPSSSSPVARAVTSPSWSCFFTWKTRVVIPAC